MAFQPPMQWGRKDHQEGMGDAVQKSEPFPPGLQTSRSMESVHPSGWRAKDGVPQEGQRHPFQGSRNCCREVVHPASQQSNFGGWSWTYSKKVTRLPKETGRSYRDVIHPTDQWGGEEHTSRRSEVPPQRGEKKQGRQTNQRKGEFIKKGRRSISSASGQAKAGINHPQEGQQSVTCNREKPGMKSKRKRVRVDIIKNEGMRTSLYYIKKERKPDGNPDGQMGSGN